MNIVHSFAELLSVPGGVCLAIGVFDGVHLGHRQVIRTAHDDAQALDAQAVVVTFDPHPMRVLQPDRAPLLLTATPHKLRLIEQLGVATCLVVNFDEAFARTPPEQFLNQVAAESPRLREICVGARFRFGHQRAGDMALIRRLAAQQRYTARAIDSVTVAGEVVSSTAIRRHILWGDLDRAARLLGRPYSILGTVERGDQVGRQLGFPTANLNPHNEVLPPDGVYVVRARWAGRTAGGVMNVGVRPTFTDRSERRLVEVHVLDFNGDLYGVELEVDFVAALRPEQRFPSVADLRRQIAIDVGQARERLAGFPT